MGGRYYKDPTADMAIANAKREAKHREDEKELLRKYTRRLFRCMRSVGMNRKEMVEMLNSEYRNLLNKYN